MSPDKRPVQSCISAVSFPTTLEDAENMGRKWENDSIWTTDMDTLLNHEMLGPAEWTMPTWISEGDIAFLYHTKRAKSYVRQLRRKVEQLPEISTRSWLHPTTRGNRSQKMSDFLQHAENQADLYSGTIFACAFIDSNAFRIDDGSEELHFQGRYFAPLRMLHVFDHPLRHDDFSSYVRIKRQGPITELSKHQFNEIREHLSVQNPLPTWLQNAEFSESGFRDITRENWASIACAPTARFLREVQVRGYFLDYLLDELKDVRTLRLEECRCMRNGSSTGLADYFIKLHGQWVPVEAKVNINVEANLPNQLRKYVHVDTFTPTTGRYKDREYIPDNTGLCLVGDQSGIYVTIDGEFVECSPEQPMWPRTEINSEMILTMREKLADFIIS